jgi:TonB family protein
VLVLQVFIMRNGAFEGTEMVSGDRIEIGRDPACAVVLDDESCSRRHAALFEHDGKVAIQDLGSANGTRINGDPVSSARYVGPRDDVAIGVFTLKLKVMTGQARAAPSPPSQDDATRVVEPPVLDAARTEALPEIGASGDDDVSVTSPSPPPVPPVSDDSERPTRPKGSRRPELAPSSPALLVDVTSPNAMPLPSSAEGGLAAAAFDAPAFDVPEGPDLPALAFSPAFLAEELEDEDEDDPPWSLVQRLVRPSSERPAGGKSNPLLEIVHYRGELVVDHRVLHEGETFRLGEGMTGAERRERGIPGVIPLVHLKRGGVAEVFQRPDVSGRLFRGGVQSELGPPAGKRSAVPITDGELASLKIGSERVFVRFAGAPQLVWTREDAREDRAARRLNAIAGGTSVGLFALMAVASWIYEYRNADQEVIALEDEGFAEVEMKLKMEEPPPEPEKPPEPVPTPEPMPEVKPEKVVSAKQEAKPTPAEQPPAPPKPGVLDILNNIPKVNDTASSQNLTAALSNIKGVRVPGAAAGTKVTPLIGKGPSSGVQIGGAAGGMSTSGINSLLRKDGQAGALGGKGDRAVSGKVVGLKSQLTKKGEGELSKEEIQKVINQHIGEIQFCYEKQLRTQPGLAGRVVLEWGVNQQGRVSVVKVAQSSMQSAEATNCMMTKLKTWKFPPPRGGSVTIVFPFVFNTV